MSFADVIREIWANDALLNAEIPATDAEDTNRVFDEGAESYKPAPQSAPNRYVVIDDQGDVEIANGSCEFKSTANGYLIRVYTEGKAKTREIATAFKAALKTNLRGSTSHECGVARCYTLEAQTYQRTGGGLRMYRAQLTVTAAQ